MVDLNRMNVETATSILTAAGFIVSQQCSSRPSCFDFAARKSDTIVFVKCQPDVGSVSPENAHELKLISESVFASTLLISTDARGNHLQDDTVYTKHNIPTITPRTLENIVVRGLNPIVRAGPGGFYVEINSGLIRKRRQQLALSVGEMAEMIGTSKRTLYGYERGLAKASVPAAYKLMWALGVPVTIAVNVFDKQSDRNRCLLSKARNILVGSRVLQRLFKRLAKYHITPVKQAPFDFLVAVPTKEMGIMGAVVEKREEGLEKRIDEVLSLSRVVETRPIFLTDGEKVSERDITCLNCSDLSRIKGAEDLISIAR